MAKREKMTYSDLFYNFMRECAVSQSYRVRNKQGITGTLYKFDVKISDTMKNYIKQWKNTELVIVKAQYAPEIKRNGVIIYDKKIR